MLIFFVWVGLDCCDVRVVACAQEIWLVTPLIDDRESLTRNGSQIQPHGPRRAAAHLDMASGMANKATRSNIDKNDIRQRHGTSKAIQQPRRQPHAHSRPLLRSQMLWRHVRGLHGQNYARHDHFARTFGGRDVGFANARRELFYRSHGRAGW